MIFVIKIFAIRAGNMRVTSQNANHIWGNWNQYCKSLLGDLRITFCKKTLLGDLRSTFFVITLLDKLSPFLDSCYAYDSHL